MESKNNKKQAITSLILGICLLILVITEILKL